MTDRSSSAPTARRRHPVLRVVVATQLVLALVTALTVTLFYRHLDSNLTSGETIEHSAVKKQPVAEKSMPTTPLNILIMGSDARDGAGNDIDGLTGDGQRADTTILMHISADRKRAYGVSIARDTLVTRPTCRDSTTGRKVAGARLQMFNTAFAIGGEACTVKTVESITGVYVDHYVTVDFNGFRDMVDAVHGVTVCIPQSIDDRAHGIVLPAGTQTLSGPNALKYVRERYSTPNSDLGRMKRQQAFIASMINKVVSAGTLTHVPRIVGFLNATTKSLTLDPDLSSVGALAKLGYQFKDTGLSNIKFVTAPVQPYPADVNRLVFAPGVRKLWKRIRNDQGLPASVTGQVITAENTPGSTGSSGARKKGKKKPSASASASASAQAESAAENGLCA